LNIMDKPDSPKRGIQGFEENCQFYHLTSREKDIAKLICAGYKYKNIGETLFIAERTVTKHAQNIFEKVGVSNKVELINKLEA
jgi:two-component system, sensor histidine kinase ChiS